MPTRAGAHNERVLAARALLSAKGRREQGAFCFEGPTLLAEAVRSGADITMLFVTDEAYARHEDVRTLDARGTPVLSVDDRTMHKLSDVETPSGVFAVTPLRYAALDEILCTPLTLVLADVNDPGNAGTLLRSAEAFGAGGAIFGRLGVDPYHPKVVRAAMGAIFRLRLAEADPVTLTEAAAAAGCQVLGLDAGGEDLRAMPPASRRALVVGHERRGLGPWEAACTRRIAIPMAGPTESLNAAVAGSIALYEASRAIEGPAGP